MSTPVIWREEHLWNVSVLQRVHLSDLVINYEIPSKPTHLDELGRFIALLTSAAQTGAVDKKCVVTYSQTRRVINGFEMIAKALQEYI
jgi:hypothetical protein